MRLQGVWNVGWAHVRQPAVAAHVESSMAGAPGKRAVCQDGAHQCTHTTTAGVEPVTQHTEKVRHTWWIHLPPPVGHKDPHYLGHLDPHYRPLHGSLRSQSQATARQSGCTPSATVCHTWPHFDCGCALAFALPFALGLSVGCVILLTSAAILT